MLEVPQALLDERRRKGLDASDEMWDGELHIVPSASERHQAVGTYRKLDWYASVGVGEVLVIDPTTRRLELFANRDGRMVPIEPEDGGLVVERLGVRPETVDGVLRLTADGRTSEI